MEKDAKDAINKIVKNTKDSIIVISDGGMVMHGDEKEITLLYGILVNALKQKLPEKLIKDVTKLSLKEKHYIAENIANFKEMN